MEFSTDLEFLLGKEKNQQRTHTDTFAEFWTWDSSSY